MASYGLVQLRWKRTRPAGQPAEDVMVNAIHCQVTDGGWTTDDRDVFEEALDALWAVISNVFPTSIGPVEVRYYNLPPAPGPVGDPAFVVLKPTRVGTAPTASTLPPQCAITLTLQTPVRRRWGRIYWGGLVTSTVEDGRFTASLLPVWLDAFETWLQTLIDGGQGVVVWHRVSWTPTTVFRISMDDVWDVQRRRRYDHAFVRQERDLTP